MDKRCVFVAEMVGGHHSTQGRGEAALRIGKERCDPCEGLFLLGIENVEDRADEQRMAGLFPMIAPFKRSASRG